MLKLIEEISELINSLSNLLIYLSKLQGYIDISEQYESQLKNSIEEEMSDVLAQIDLFIERNKLNYGKISNRKKAKYNKYKNSIKK